MVLVKGSSDAMIDSHSGFLSTVQHIVRRLVFLVQSINCDGWSISRRTATFPNTLVMNAMLEIGLLFF